MAKFRSSPKPRSTINTKTKIMETAVELFSQQGYNGVSIRDITNAVGIKESSLYNHFLSKRAVMEEIYAFFKATFNAENPVKNISSSVKPVDSYLMLQEQLLTLRQIFERPILRKIFRILSMERYRDRRAFEIFNHDIYQSMTKSYEELFKSMISSGIIKPLLNPCLLGQEYAYTVLGMFNDLNIQKYYKLGTAQTEYSMHEYVKFFWERVRNI